MENKAAMKTEPRMTDDTLSRKAAELVNEQITTALFAPLVSQPSFEQRVANAAALIFAQVEQPLSRLSESYKTNYGAALDREKDLLTALTTANAELEKLRDVELALASTADLVNSWAREYSVAECKPESIKDAIDALWVRSSYTLTTANAEVDKLRQQSVELVKYLREKAAHLSGEAASRRQSAETYTGATVAEMKAGKKLAEIARLNEWAALLATPAQGERQEDKA